MVLPMTAEEWLALAAETREMAHRMVNQDARVTMLEVAAGYEELAAHVARRDPDAEQEKADRL